MGRSVHHRNNVAMYVSLFLEQPFRRLTSVYSLESGLLYPTTLVASQVFLAITDSEHSGSLPFDLAPTSGFLSVYTDDFYLDIYEISQGFAPMPIILRVAHVGWLTAFRL